MYYDNPSGEGVLLDENDTISSSEITLNNGILSLGTELLLAPKIGTLNILGGMDSISSGTVIVDDNISEFESSENDEIFESRIIQ